MDTPKQKPNSYWLKKIAKFSVGEKVEVYSLMGCKDFIGIKTIKCIEPMNSSPKQLPMIYFVEGGGCHHIGAIAKIKESK